MFLNQFRFFGIIFLDPARHFFSLRILSSFVVIRLNSIPEPSARFMSSSSQLWGIQLSVIQFIVPCIFIGLCALAFLLFLFSVQLRRKKSYENRIENWRLELKAISLALLKPAADLEPRYLFISVSFFISRLCGCMFLRKPVSTRRFMTADNAKCALQLAAPDIVAKHERQLEVVKCKSGNWHEKCFLPFVYRWRAEFQPPGSFSLRCWFFLGVSSSSYPPLCAILVFSAFSLRRFVRHREP